MDIGYPVLVNAVSAAAAKITQVDSPCHSCRFLQAGVMVTKKKKKMQQPRSQYLGMQINMFCLASLIHLRYCVCSITLSKPNRMQANDRADRLAGKAAITSGLRLGISDVLKSWRHCLQAQSQGHRSPEEERSRKKKRSTIFSFLERTKDGRCQSDENWNRFKGNVGETSRRRAGAHNYGVSQGIKYISSGTEPKSVKRVLSKSLP